MSEKFSPVFHMAWSGVDTMCEDCGKSIPASMWFYRGWLNKKRLCERCYEKTEVSHNA